MKRTTLRSATLAAAPLLVLGLLSQVRADRTIDVHRAANVHQADYTVGEDTYQTPPVADYDDITVQGGSVIAVALDGPLSSASTPVGDTFTATICTQRMGDSEFPPGTKVAGIVVESRHRTHDQPGVLDLDFHSVILPNGTHLSLDGRLYSLDSKDIVTRHGHVVARDSSGSRVKAVGVGAGAGYVIGHLILGHNGLYSGILGAIGGLIFGPHHNKTRDVSLQPGTHIGVLVENPVTYSDRDYRHYRDRYLQ